VPPLLPHAPQVSQLFESSILSITVGPPVVGVGEGEGVGVGVGDGVGPGVEGGWVLWALTVTGAMLPPQEVSVKVTRTKSAQIKTACKTDADRKCFKGNLRQYLPWLSVLAGGHFSSKQTHR
jgi:hypothetical protein